MDTGELSVMETLRMHSLLGRRLSPDQPWSVLVAQPNSGVQASQKGV